MWATCWAPSRASCRAWQVTVTLGDLGSVGVWKASLATLGDLDMAAQISCKHASRAAKVFKLRMNLVVQFGPLVRHAFAERADLKQLADQADVQRRLECLLEALRGAAGGMAPCTQVRTP